MRAAVMLATGVATLLTGCSTADDTRAAEQAGARAAAQAYVDAIAARDPEAADAMTDPAAFEHITFDDNLDVRQALTDAVDPITDPWVTIVGPGSDYGYGTVEYVVDVSWTIRDLTGGDTIEIELAEGGDPADVDDWIVKDPLLTYGTTYSEIEHARLGSVELTFGDTHRGVAGYPGGYLLEPAEPTRGVQPLWIALGAADAPPWDDSLPKLSRHKND